MSLAQPTYSPGQRHEVDLASGVTMAFRFVPPTGPEGFRMGNRGLSSYEEPVHRVRISPGFWLGETVVTQAQFAVWTAVMKENHENGFPGCPGHPAERMTWSQAVRFCAWLAERHAGKLPDGFALACLPTESEWEWACRAGSETDYYNGDGESALAEIGWYDGNAGEQTHAVDERAERHPWNLRGMHGNVWEWCHDVYDDQAYRRRLDGDGDPAEAGRADEMRAAGSPDAAAKARWKALLEDRQLRAVRGGAWGDHASRCRSAFRDWAPPVARYRFFGFRVCLAPGPAERKTEAEQAEAAGGRERRRPARPESSATDAAGAGGGKPHLSDLATARFPKRTQT